MDRVNNSIALSQYLATPPQKNSVQFSFQQMLANAAAAAPTSTTSSSNAASSYQMPSTSGLSTNAPVDPASLTADLNTALSAFGISTPPSLRITAGPDGLQLGDDDRNAKFQAMLKANPGLQSSLQQMLGSATMDRKSALDSAMLGLAGSNPSPQIAGFLEGFEDSETPKSMSISFNGSSASVDELDANGWQPVKSKATFSNELLAAYAKYLVKFGVSTEKRKDQDETDADIALKKDLAKAAGVKA